MLQTKQFPIPEGMSKAALQRDLEELAALSPIAAVATELRKTALVALLCGAVGWLSEWLVAPWLRPGGAALVGLPPLAPIVFIVGVALLLTTLLGVMAVWAGRYVASGRATVEVSGRIYAAIPSWWVRCLLVFITFTTVILSIGGVGLLGVWARNGDAAAAKLFVTEINKVLQFAVLVSFTAGMLMFLRIVSANYRLRMRKFLLASERLWWIKCTLEGAVCGAVAFGVLMGLAAVVDGFASATVLGSTVSFANVTATALFGAWLGFLFGRWEWRDREQERLRAMVDRPLDYLNDFRTWDMEPETSLSGSTAEGYPLYVWRESADNRLGLSRPRYCCVVRDGDELLFQFYNPVGAQRQSIAMAVGCIIGGAAALWTLVDYFVLGHTNTAATAPFATPPVLIVLNAALKAGVLGGLAGGAWYVVATPLRWFRNRFASDGRLYSRPWHELDNFRTLSAADAGATINGEPARQGEGLAAVFIDGTQIVITANSWEHTSNVARHALLTRMFVIERDAMQSTLAQLLKAEKRATTSGTSAVENGDIPVSL